MTEDYFMCNLYQTIFLSCSILPTKVGLLYVGGLNEPFSEIKVCLCYFSYILFALYFTVTEAVFCNKVIKMFYYTLFHNL